MSRADKPPSVPEPTDADVRRRALPVVVYDPATLPPVDWARVTQLKAGMTHKATIMVPPRDGRTFVIPAGHICRIVSVDGPQVGDLNLWHAHDPNERFFSGKTRALHGTHVGVGDQLWSNLPYLRPMATITADTLGWYGYDADGAGVHDVIGTRCDPYTNRLLHGTDYHNCCHSNLTRALSAHLGTSLSEAEPLVHDVLNVFMCTGFTADTHQYFMKASPVRPGDYFEFVAEIDLLGALSACPGGDCGGQHSSDVAVCHPLLVEIYAPAADMVPWPISPVNSYRHPND